MRKADSTLLSKFRRISTTIKMRHRKDSYKYRKEESALVSFCVNYLNQIGRNGHYYHLPHSVFAEKILAFYGANCLYRLVVNGSLNGREALVLKHRYGSEMFERKTLDEIAKILGYNTKERIRQIEAKALRKLLHPSRQRSAFREKENEFLLNRFFEERRKMGIIPEAEDSGSTNPHKRSKLTL